MGVQGNCHKNSPKTEDRQTRVLRDAKLTERTRNGLAETMVLLCDAASRSVTRLTSQDTEAATTSVILLLLLPMESHEVGETQQSADRVWIGFGLGLD